uniref:L1 transposable element RRM domain-containing protein n=1 Tax=Salmo trutta TaxID=8032 RepID=A0A673W4H9_SALTR
LEFSSSPHRFCGDLVSRRYLPSQRAMDLQPRGKKDDQNVVDSQDNDNATASKISISPHNSDDSSRLLLSAASCKPANMLATLQDGNKGLSMKIEKKSADLHSSIDDLKSSMNDLLLRTTEAELRISTVEDTIARHDQVLIELQKDNAYLKNKVDQMENQSRRSNIRVVGLKEDSEGRDPVRFFTRIPDVLGIINFTKPLEIERAHRTSAPKPRPDEPLRAILIRFLHFQDTEKILQLARANGDIPIDGKRVSLFPDMSADLARRRKQFRPAAKALKEKNTTGYLIHPAWMKVQYKGRSHIFNTPGEVFTFLK